MFTTFKKVQVGPNIEEAASPVRKAHKSMVNKLFQNKYVGESQFNFENHFSQDFERKKKGEGPDSPLEESNFNSKFVGQSESFNLSELKTGRLSKRVGLENFTSISKIQHESTLTEKESPEETSSRMESRRSGVFTRKKKAIRDQIHASELKKSEFPEKQSNRSQAQFAENQKVVVVSQNNLMQTEEGRQASGVPTTEEESGGVDQDSLTDQSMAYQSKHNSMMMVVRLESNRGRTGGPCGVDFNGTGHNREHVVRLEKLSKQSSQFNSKILENKKKLKNIMRQYKIISKNLMASYQITTLSHLLISIIEKDENFTEEPPNEIGYSMNRRKVNLDYFEKKPQFRTLAEKWENNLMEAL